IVAHPLGEPLDDRRKAHAEPDAQAREPVVEILSLHLMEHRRDQPGAAHPERVAQGDRAAVHVQLGIVEADRFPGGDRDGREGLVDLPDVDVVDLQVGARQRLPDRRNRAVQHDRWVRARDAGGDETGARFELQLPRLVRRRHEDPARAVIDAARVAGGDATIRLERRRKRGELLHGGRATRMLVRVEHLLVAALIEHGDRFDLLLEAAFVDRPDRLAVGPEGELVHLPPRDLVLVRDEVGRDALLNDLVFLEQLRAQRSGVGAQSDTGHHLDAARDDDVVLTRHDLHRGEVERLESRGAHPVHAGPRDRLRESRDQRREAGDVQALFVDLGDAAQHDILDDLRLDPGSVRERPKDERGQLVRSPVFQRAGTLPNRRAYGVRMDGSSIPPPKDPPHTHGAWLTRGTTAVHEQFVERDIPVYFSYAKRFSLCDNYYTDVAGPSTPNHLMLLCADSPIIDNPPRRNPPTIQIHSSLPKSLEQSRLTWRTYGGCAPDSMKRGKPH